MLKIKKNKSGACRHPMSKGTSDVQRVACKKAFSILELVFAIFVLTIGIVGALKLISSTIINSISTRNAVIATGLAQEGVELVRNIRDNNMLLSLSDLSRDSGADFTDNGFPNNILNGSDWACIFDYKATAACDVFTQQATNDRAKLYLDASGFYTHTSSSATTAFRRQVKFDYEEVAGDILGVNIISKVWWGESMPATCNFANKCIEVKDYLPKRD